MREWSRQTTVGWWIALAWGLLIPIAGLVVPAGIEASVGDDGIERQRSLTLVEQNGASLLLTLCVPLAFVLVFGLLLGSRRRGTGAVLWILWDVIAALNVLALFSIGIAVIPVTVGLLIALLGRSAAASRATAAVRPSSPPMT